MNNKRGRTNKRAENLFLDSTFFNFTESNSPSDVLISLDTETQIMEFYNNLKEIFI